MADSSSSSLRILGFILCAVVAASGWMWGLKYKNVADGDQLAVDEKILIHLQNQVDQLFEENERLAKKLSALQAEPSGENGK